MRPHHWLLGYWPRRYFGEWIRSDTSRTHPPRFLAVVDPSDISTVFFVPLLVLEAVHRVASSVEFIAVLIRR